MAGKSGDQAPEEAKKLRPKYDPYKIAFENLSQSGYPEDLVEFKRRIALYARMQKEEADRIGMEL